jgi:short-chain fatty acids transporter
VSVAKSFGEGFWSLITFTMQMAMVVISGYVVATSPPAAKLIDGLAACRAADVPPWDSWRPSAC